VVFFDFLENLVDLQRFSPVLLDLGRFLGGLRARLRPLAVVARPAGTSFAPCSRFRALLADLKIIHAVSRRPVSRSNRIDGSSLHPRARARVGGSE
jgi:hypothetical protein